MSPSRFDSLRRRIYVYTTATAAADAAGDAAVVVISAEICGANIAIKAETPPTKSPANKRRRRPSQKRSPRNGFYTYARRKRHENYTLSV